ncbi:MAG TPA: sulfatase-like hydrolase/transferase [Elusimicrobiota bacterium]|nr:sulfatase-like hydrolase/transferase [Elusimicrobiota bacterium]
MKKTAAPRNLVLVSVDSLRFDAPACEDDTRYLAAVDPALPARRRTPVLDALARTGVHFSGAVSSSPYTTNAHAGLFTGQWPWRHGVRSLFGQEKVPAGVPLLAELFKAAGFSTLSASGMPHIFHSDSFGFRRGFDDLRDISTHLFEERLSGVFRWLREHGRERFFVFFHTASVHDYLTEAQWERRAGRPIADPDALYRALREPCGRALDKRLAAYLDAVNFFDRNELGPLRDLVGSLGCEESTMWVILGDHGEPHPVGLEETEVRVPVIFSGNGSFPRGEKIDVPVGLMDVFPTILEFFGLRPPPGLPSKSLSRCWGPRPTRPSEIYMEHFASPRSSFSEPSSGPAERGTALLRGLRRGRHKLIRDCEKDEWRAYDLRRDWGERHPCDPRSRKPFAPLKRRLLSIERQEGSAVESEAGRNEKPSADIVARLRQLGYLD